jgi:hypothetical protein
MRTRWKGWAGTAFTLSGKGFVPFAVNLNRTKPLIGIVIGSLLLVISPIAAVVLTWFGMLRAFDTLGGSGISDPNRLSGNIGAVLIANSGGLIGSAIGLVILIVSIVLFVRAERGLSTSNAKPVATGND